MTHSGKALVALGAMVALLASGCEGPRGPAGPAGDEGGKGSDGGPNGAPRIFALAPAEGSARSTITIDGAHFSDLASENEVFFDGTRAEILEASTERLVVRPVGAVVREARSMQVTVVKGGSASNGYAFVAHPSGAVLPVVPAALGLMASVATGVDGELFVVNVGGGFFRLDPQTGTLESVPGLETMPAPIAASIAPDGRTAYLLGAPDPFESDLMVIVRLDLETGAWVTSQPFSDTVQGILATERFVVTVDTENSQLKVFDPSLRKQDIWALPASGLGGFGSLEGLAAIGDVLYIAGGAAELYAMNLGVTPPTVGPIALPPIGSIRGIAADGDRLRLLTTDGELEVDPSVPAVVASEGTFIGLGSFWQRSSEGEWFGSQSSAGGVQRWSPAAPTITGIHPPFFPLAMVTDGTDLIWGSPLCVTSPGGIGGLWRTTATGTEPIATDLCVTDIEWLDGGRLLAASFTTDVSTFGLRAIDPVTGELEVLMDGLAPIAGIARTDTHIYFSDASNVTRMRLDGGVREEGWATAASEIADMDVAGDGLVLRNSNGIELIPLETGGTATTAVHVERLGTPFGMLAVDNAGRALLADGLGLQVLEGDELRPLVSIPPMAMRFTLMPVVAAVPLPSGELVIAGLGSLFRALP